MESTLYDLIPRLDSLGLLTYWAVFLVGVLESLPIIGIFVPGSLLLVGFGYMANQGMFHLGDLIWAAFFGSVISDSIGYYLGRHKGRKLFKETSWFFKPKYLEEADKYFSAHGGKSIFLGRFVGVFRPFVSVIAGIHHVRYSKFLFYNVTSGFLWSATYILMGYFFAEQAKSILDWISSTAYLLVAVVTLIGVVLYVWRKVACKRNV